MFSAIERSIPTYHAPLISLALIVGIVGFLSCLVLAQKIRDGDDIAGWTLLLGATLTLSLWCTHFIGLLATVRPSGAPFSLVTALSSLVVGLSIIVGGTWGVVRWRARLPLATVAAVVVGVGIVAMYHLAAFVPYGFGSISLAPSRIVTSTVFGIVLGAFSIALLLAPPFAGVRSATLIALITLAMVMHLFSSSVPFLFPRPGSLQGGEGVSGWLFAVVVGLMTLKVMLLGAVLAFLQPRWSRRRRPDPADLLSALPDRHRFRKMVNGRLHRARADRDSLALMSINLDSVRAFDLAQGHVGVDRLLGTIVERVETLTRGTGVLARLGGEDLALLLVPADRVKAARFTTRLHDELGESIPAADSTVPIGLSIGVAMFPVDGSDVDTLLQRAHAAMQRARVTGASAGTGVFFDPSVHARLDRQHRLEKRLRRALVRRNLELHYQPLVSSGARCTVCMEALLRWSDDELGEVGPDDFIPVAERSGLIVPIGEYVLNQACLDAMSWSRELRVAVNLSAVQFVQGDLVAMVMTALNVSGLPGHRLELEITESMMLDDGIHTLEIIDALRGLGVKIAMDDFGTGYSSLGYLQRFGFDKMKIDRSFVSGIDKGNASSIGIVTAAIAMARTLDMRVVAEGVETAAQAVLLTELECDELQGFLIARPMPAGRVNTFLQDA